MVQSSSQLTKSRLSLFIFRWYVNQEFTGVNDFDVIDDMLISCNQYDFVLSYRFVYLQERGKENPGSFNH